MIREIQNIHMAKDNIKNGKNGNEMLFQHKFYFTVYTNL